jgi:hypothetical protein
VLESEEAYYLRRTCGRNNARILKMVADEMGLCVPSTMDTCAYDPCEMAVCTTETMINDVQRQKDGRICVLVNCVDSTRIDNGVLCSMHPAEGFWLFKVSGASLCHIIFLTRLASFSMRFLAFQGASLCHVIFLTQHVGCCALYPGINKAQFLPQPLRWSLWRRVHADEHALVHEQDARELLMG